MPIKVKYVFNPYIENPCGEIGFSKPRYSKKIGMNLGIEYLVRSGLIKSFMTLPCSIFVKTIDNIKKVITINKANVTDSEKYCIRNWSISNCQKDQPVPSMTEHMVHGKDLYNDPAVILKGFAPLHFDCSSVQWRRNRGNHGHPMADYIYQDYFQKMLFPLSHKFKKENFLWKTFVNTYIPALPHMVINQHLIENNVREKELLKTNFKTLWQSWQKWQKFMLFDTVPGELIFMKDYLTETNAAKKAFISKISTSTTIDSAITWIVNTS